MGLVDLKTDLKSLKFGKDRPFGGSSNQPYIKRDIPDKLPASSPDFLLRNGFLNPVSSATDVARLTKYFFDLKTPSGILFTAKQNLLSRSAVRTQASVGPLNDKIYLPTSTLLQAAGVSAGLHLNKQGAFAGIGEDLGTSATYVSRIRFISSLGPGANRLVELYDSKIDGQFTLGIPLNNVSALPGELLKYRGGPGSILGYGNTTIKFAKGSPGIPSQIGPLRTGNNNLQIKLSKASGFVTGKIQNVFSQVDYTDKLGATYKYDASSTTNANIQQNTLLPNPLALGSSILNPEFNPQIYNQSPKGNILIGSRGPEVDKSELKQATLRPAPTIDYNRVLGVDKSQMISGKAGSVTAKYYISANASGYTDAQTGEIIDDVVTGEGESLSLKYTGNLYKKSDSGELLLNPNNTGPQLDPTYPTGSTAYRASDINAASRKSTLGLTTKYQVSPTGSLVDPLIYKQQSGSFETPQLDNARTKVSNTISSSFASLRNAEQLKQALGLSTKYSETLDAFEPLAENTGLLSGSNTLGRNISVYKPDTEGKVSLQPNDATTTNLNVYTYNNDQIQNSIPVSKGGSVGDFRKSLRDALVGGTAPFQMVDSKSPPYSGESGKNIEQRVNLGDPGRRGRTFTSYVEGPGPYVLENTGGGTTATGSQPLDKINALPVYKSTAVTGNPVKNDLVKFRIAAIDSDNPNQKEFMHFRAFIDSFSDSYQATWNPIQYVGRGENFYSYGGFNRTISMGWTVAAQSKPELIAMYKKLNFLASNLAPDYSSAGYMRGPLVQLTVGGYVYEQVGFITAMTIDIPEDSTWEIGINDTNAGNDRTVKELPHMVRVTGFQFTPIHEFVPRKQKNKYGTTLVPEEKKGKTVITNTVLGVSDYGSQQYIALAANENEDQTNWNYIEQFTGFDKK